MILAAGSLKCCISSDPLSIGISDPSVLRCDHIFAHRLLALPNGRTARTGDLFVTLFVIWCHLLLKMMLLFVVIDYGSICGVHDLRLTYHLLTCLYTAIHDFYLVLWICATSIWSNDKGRIERLIQFLLLLCICIVAFI